MQKINRKVLILAPFFTSDDTWIDDFSQTRHYEFIKARFRARQVSWHQRGATTPLWEWIYFFRYAYEAMKVEPDCIVTCFPQLAFVVAALLRITRKRKVRLIAWTFNLGSLPIGWKRILARVILSRTDLFVVHARGEVQSYSEWLNIKVSRFIFVPLQRGEIGANVPTKIPKPYIVSLGSANRDYETLVSAVSTMDVRTVIVSKKECVEALPDLPNLIKLHGLSSAECDSIISGAEIAVLPLRETRTASGQVAFTTSMRMSVPVIATRSVGTVDYIRDGETGLLVPGNDIEALRSAIISLWSNPKLRMTLGCAARTYSDKHFSDHAIGKQFGIIIDEVLVNGELCGDLEDRLMTLD